MPGSVWRHVDADITLDGLDHLLGDGSLILPLTLLGDEQVSIHVGIEQRQLTPVPAQTLSDMLGNFGNEIFSRDSVSGAGTRRRRRPFGPSGSLK